MFNVSLAGDHLVWEIAVHVAVAGESLMVSDFVLSFFPRDVLDEIWD